MERTPKMLLIAHTDTLNSIVDKFIENEQDNEEVKRKMPYLMEDIETANRMKMRHE